MVSKKLKVPQPYKLSMTYCNKYYSSKYNSYASCRDGESKFLTNKYPGVIIPVCRFD